MGAIRFRESPHDAKRRENEHGVTEPHVPGECLRTDLVRDPRAEHGEREQPVAEPQWEIPDQPDGIGCGARADISCDSARLDAILTAPLA